MTTYYATKRSEQSRGAQYRSLPRQAAAFADACAEQNDADDLIDSLLEPHADPKDCQTWDITPTQWRLAVATALKAQFAALTDA